MYELKSVLLIRCSDKQIFLEISVKTSEIVQHLTMTGLGPLQHLK